MADKKIKTRIQQKHDIEANWLKATSFIPLAGEVIVYDVDDNYNYARVKIGDGINLVTNLPFLTESVKCVTHSELRTLRNRSQLIPGVFYRITDYCCSVSDAARDNGISTANHGFDIIVQALSNNTLSELAKADYNSSESYFQTISSEVYIEPLYMILEDQDSISDPDANYQKSDVFIDYSYEANPGGEIVPVLYKTDITTYPDEPDYGDKFYYVGTFDFNGRTYDRWQKVESDENDNNYTWHSRTQKFVLTDTIVEDGVLNESKILRNIKVPIANIPAWELKYCLDNDTTRFAWANPEGCGVIYYMKDEWDNECSYDFKNIQFHRDSYPALYTFSWINEDGNVEDLTMRQDLTTDVESERRCTYSNRIASKVLDGILILNNIVFISDYASEGDDYFYGCFGNTFGHDCSDMTFLDGCNNNAFGAACSRNTFKQFCSNNTFSYHCFLNIFGANCVNNSFGKSCNGNSLEDYCSDNIFGNNCGSNIFEYQCSSNNLGAECHSNKFYENCYANTLDSSCSNNTFENTSRFNKLGHHCTNIRLAPGSENNTFGNYCAHFWTDPSENPAFAYSIALRNSQIANYCQYICVTCNTSFSTRELDHITIGSGLHGTAQKALYLNEPKDYATYEISGAEHVMIDIEE